MLGYEKSTPTSFTLPRAEFATVNTPVEPQGGSNPGSGEERSSKELGSTCRLKPYIQNAPNTLRAFTEHIRTHRGTNETTEQASLFPCLLNQVLPVVSFYNIPDANREMEEKLKIVNYLKQHPSCLKSMKISKKMTQEMMGDLLTNTKLTLVSLHGAAAYYHLHVMIVNTQKMTYIDIEPEDAESTLILSVHGAHMFCVQRTWTEELVKTQYLKQDSHERVLRSLSSYHRQELLTMAQKCRIVHDPKDKKEELYNKILKGTYGSL